MVDFYGPEALETHPQLQEKHKESDETRMLANFPERGAAQLFQIDLEHKFWYKYSKAKQISYSCIFPCCN